MDFQIEPGEMQTTVDRDIVPAGTHRMVVRAAEEGPNEYKTHETNPDGQCLKLRLATVEGNYRFVFDDLPRHLAWRAQNLAEALGIQPQGGMLRVTPADCQDRELMVEISHYTSKAGKTSAVVKRYVPQSANSTAKPATRPRPAVAATAGDDIPFLWLVTLALSAATIGVI